MLTEKSTVAGYVNLIEATYKWNFFFAVGLGMALANGLRLLLKVTTVDKQSFELNRFR